MQEEQIPQQKEHVIPAEYTAEVDKIAAKFSSFKEIVNEDGSLKFDFFIEVFKTAAQWSDHGFKELRAELVKKRRGFYEKQDPESRDKYYKTCMLIAVQEEDYFYKYLSAIL